MNFAYLPKGCHWEAEKCDRGIGVPPRTLLLPLYTTLHIQAVKVILEYIKNSPPAPTRTRVTQSAFLFWHGFCLSGFLAPQRLKKRFFPTSSTPCTVRNTWEPYQGKAMIMMPKTCPHRPPWVGGLPSDTMGQTLWAQLSRTPRRWARFYLRFISNPWKEINVSKTLGAILKSCGSTSLRSSERAILRYSSSSRRT